MDYLIGLDLGSTALKGVSIDVNGIIIQQRSTNVNFVKNNDADIVEIDPNEYLSSVFSTIKSLLIPEAKCLAISWAAASGNILFLDSEDKPISNIFSWLDRRPVKYFKDSPLTLQLQKYIYQLVGWPFSPQFPLGRFMWLKSFNSEIFDKADKICMSNDYLLMNLTGKYFVDESTATTMYLYNQITGQKVDALLSLSGIKKKEMIPNRISSGTHVGTLLPQICKQLGFLSHSPECVIGTFDHPSAARAIGLEKKDQMLLSCGTSWVGCILLPNRDFGLKHNLLIDPYTQNSGGSWLGMFSVGGIGKIFDNWVFTLLSKAGITTSTPFITFDELAIAGDSNLVKKIDLTSHNIINTVDTLLEKYKVEDIARATLEDVVFSLYVLMEQKGINISQINEVFLVGGPTKSPIWPSIIAAVFGKKVTVRFGQIAGSVGAVMLAAKTMKLDISLVDSSKVFIPKPQYFNKMQTRYKKYWELT